MARPAQRALYRAAARALPPGRFSNRERTLCRHLKGFVFMLNRCHSGLLLVSTIAAMTGLSGGAALAEPHGVELPAGVASNPAIDLAIAKGDFRAKIAPRFGYQGQLVFGSGKLPALGGPRTQRQPGQQRAQTPGAHDFYPADVVDTDGYVLASASHVNVYWGESNSSTWGYPDTYEYYLNVNPMIHTLDQYAGSSANGRYPVASVYWSGGGPGNYVSQAGVAAEAAYVATNDVNSWGQPGGFGNIVNVFLPPGTDTCFDNGSGCYNPDNRPGLGAFTFCAYHSYTYDGNGNIVFYTVEPYQSVSGCSAGYGLSNDTANVLGHEIAETISDAAPGYGYIGKNILNNGQEIGDECAWVEFSHTLAKNITYVTQDWYSNHYHACASVK